MLFASTRILILSDHHRRLLIPPPPPLFIGTSGGTPPPRRVPRPRAQQLEARRDEGEEVRHHGAGHFLKRGLRPPLLPLRAAVAPARREGKR